ncbi:MAG: hypothetical protein U0T56_00375 [Ferruginibacter sp.]|jgi:ribosomal protein S20
MQTVIYLSVGFSVGFLAAWVIRTISVFKWKKEHKSTSGYLESEKLIRETLQKENRHVYQAKEAVESEYERQLAEAHALIRRMDEDILLLQKSNEETEALLRAGEPVIHSLKMKLIEANNTAARYKAQLLQQSVKATETAVTGK